MPGYPGRLRRVQQFRREPVGQLPPLVPRVALVPTERSAAIRQRTRSRRVVHIERDDALLTQRRWQVILVVLGVIAHPHSLTPAPWRSSDNATALPSVVGSVSHSWRPTSACRPGRTPAPAATAARPPRSSRTRQWDCCSGPTKRAAASALRSSDATRRCRPGRSRPRWWRCRPHSTGTRARPRRPAAAQRRQRPGQPVRSPLRPAQRDMTSAAPLERRALVHGSAISDRHEKADNHSGDSRQYPDPAEAAAIMDARQPRGGTRGTERYGLCPKR